MVCDMDSITKVENEGIEGKTRRGRLAANEWQQRARYVLRHLDDPIALQRSPICRLLSLEKLAKSRYPNGIVARGRALHDLTQDCLQDIENELDGHAGLHRLKQFVNLTRQRKGPTEASRIMGISPEHTSRMYKRILVRFLAQKLLMKLR